MFSQFQMTICRKETVIGKDFNCSVWTGIVPFRCGTSCSVALTRKLGLLLCKIWSGSKLSDSFTFKKPALCSALCFSS